MFGKGVGFPFWLAELGFIFEPLNMGYSRLSFPKKSEKGFGQW